MYLVCVSWHHKRALWEKYPSSRFCTQSCGCETKHGFDGFTIVACVAPLMEQGATKAIMEEFINKEKIILICMR